MKKLRFQNFTSFHLNLNSTHKPNSKQFTNSNLKVEMKVRTVLGKQNFSSLAQRYLKNYNSSFLSPKFINFIPWKIDSKGYNFPEDTFVRFCPQVSQILASSGCFIQQKDRTGMEIQSTLENHRYSQELRKILKFLQYKLL